jgi:hypothetical protein
LDPAVARAIIELALFLELSDDDTVDPDAAVSALEGLSANLARASPLARASLLQELNPMSSSNPDVAAANLAEGLGLLD